jgi:hypothetical protein
MEQCAKEQQRTGPPTTTMRTVTITMDAVHDDAELEELGVLEGEEMAALVVRMGRLVAMDVRIEV